MFHRAKGFEHRKITCRIRTDHHNYDSAGSPCGRRYVVDAARTSATRLLV